MTLSQEQIGRGYQLGERVATVIGLAGTGSLALEKMDADTFIPANRGFNQAVTARDKAADTLLDLPRTSGAVMEADEAFQAGGDAGNPNYDELMELMRFQKGKVEGLQGQVNSLKRVRIGGGLGIAGAVGLAVLSGLTAHKLLTDGLINSEEYPDDRRPNESVSSDLPKY